MQHAVMSSQCGVPHPGMTANQYGMRQNPIGMGMGMPHGGMVSAQHGMSSPQPVAQMRMTGPLPRMGNPHIGHMAPHMAGGMVRNPMMSGGMVPGQPVNYGMPMGSRQPPVIGHLQGGLMQMCFIQQRIIASMNYRIITHRRNCQLPDCPICLPFKHASLQHNRGEEAPADLCSKTASAFV